MMPQSTFMVLARIDPRREVELRQLLATMNDSSGRANPTNSLFPFARFDMLHVGRFVILDDKTADDIRVYGLQAPIFPTYLAFVGDVDGEGDAFLREAARVAEAGLRTIFDCCDDFTPADDLLAWMRSHNTPSAASYVNRVGRTVRRVREDAALRASVEHFLNNGGRAAVSGAPARHAHATLRNYVDGEKAAGRLTLSPEERTPLGWRIADTIHLIGVPLVALLLSPVLLVLALAGLLRLRMLEKTDAELCPRVDVAYSNTLAAIEDLEVSNQFNAMGSLKPGLLRLWSAMTVFFAIDYAARHIYARSGLARVRTIHFARWVFLDGRKRAIFMSNYDGSLEAYMDDFINRVGFGLNLAFNAGVGYPRTRWLALDGCNDERKFKEFLRRHQLPSQVWYKAYPELTAVDLERNRLLRDGLETPELDDQQAREWMAIL